MDVSTRISIYDCRGWQKANLCYADLAAAASMSAVYLSHLSGATPLGEETSTRDPIALAGLIKEGYIITCLLDLQTPFLFVAPLMYLETFVS